MAFDKKAFLKAKFEPRTEVLTIPALRGFFDAGEEPKFVVRGLDVYEFAAVKEAKLKSKNVDNLINILANEPAQIEALREAVGVVSNDVPGELASRLEALKLGLVEPEMDQQMVVVFAKRFPIDFWVISQKVLELTGMGMEIKKLPPSGESVK